MMRDDAPSTEGRGPAAVTRGVSQERPRVSGFQHYRILLGKDLRREFRTREMLSSMGIYTLLVLVIFGTALVQASSKVDILQMSGGLFWALIVFTSLLGLNRSFAYEKEDGALEGILLVPLDRSVIFLAKLTANLLFLLIVEIVAIPLFFVFFLSGLVLQPTLALALGPLLAGTIGIAGIGTLLATITSNTRGKDVLLALLFVPLIFPLLYACVSATTLALTAGSGPLDGYVPALALAVGYDVVMLSLSWLLYDFVVSA
ncbi:MAG: heme exporter protein CcmB [Coriobacteriales bacterium]|jgi:heme exporter protein B|nr:heme exporter protein CcmB [Coriobacteriales bacterium]